MAIEVKNISVAKIKEFLETPKGKRVTLIVVATLVVFVLGMGFLFFFLLGKAPQVPERAVQPPLKAEETAPAEAVETTAPAPAEGYEIYEYKDPFKPLITAPTTETIAEPTTPTAGPVPLALDDIFVEDGVTYASIRYGDAVYKVTEGDRVDESPYQVLSIGTDSVVLLYGDDRITLRLGEEILK
ncbi:MAG: hypothetical protein QMD08_02555 [Actinomycetota bacterium]|nr:hypothetical protein [Actinomycetota bacterium]